MKKIGILTYYYKSKNMGGLLQAYALVAFLNKNNCDARQISFDYTFFDAKVRKIALYLRADKITFKKILSKVFQLFSNVIFKFKIDRIYKNIQIQNEKFAEFEKFISHSKYYNNSTIVHANEDYDIFITGSDQVFATYLLPLSAYYGEFTTPDKKVISYAASSNVKQFESRAEQLFIKKLARLNSVSVREKTLKDYIEKITDKKADVVLDSTFLLSKEDWLKIANTKVVLQKPYIFCYFLGSKSAWQRKKAQDYADKYGYELVHLPYIMRSVRVVDKYLKGQGVYNVGPREFIALINNAECVFTDSFHGLAFSINFGKKFYVFDRDDESGANSMNARITDTLERFGLTSRHITDKNAKLDNKPLDFTKVHKILEEDKAKSVAWLLNVLKD